MRAVAYLRRSRADENGQRLGLDAQLERIEGWAAYRGAELVARVTDDGVSGGRAPEHRPGWNEAVRMLEVGEADVVVVARLDRLTRSVLHFTQVVDALGDRIVCLDPELDTTTASGRMAANIFAAFGQYERDLISERTRAALKVKKANGWQPGKLTREDRAKIVRLFGAGETVAQITRTMTEDLGRQVHRTSVANVVRAEVAGGRRGSLRKLTTGPS